MTESTEVYVFKELQIVFQLQYDAQLYHLSSLKHFTVT